MKLNQRGFSLVEMMLALGITAVIGFSSAQMVSMLTQANGTMDSKFGQLQLQKDLQKVVSKSSSCLGAIQNRNFSTSGETPVTIKLDNNIVVGGDPSHQLVRAYGVKVNSLKFTAPRLVDSINGTDSVYGTQLVLESQAMKGGKDSQFARTPVALVRVKVAGGQITDCYTLEQTENINQVGCDQLSGTRLDGVCRVMPQMGPVECPDGQYLQGFDTTGAKTCKPLPPVQIVIDPASNADLWTGNFS